MAYISDFRARVFECVLSGKNCFLAASIFNVCEKTVRNWMKLYEETGEVEPRPHRGGRKSNINAEDFKLYVNANPDKTLVEMGKHFGLSYEGVAYNLRKHGYVNKKTLLYKERNEQLRLEYLEQLADIPVDNLVYVDESGVDHNDISQRCWTLKGTEVIGERSGKARGRTSVIAILNGDHINAPMTYRGTMNTALFLHWIQYLLVPSLVKGQVVIMDNASIHKNI